jgi:AmpD protein
VAEVNQTPVRQKTNMQIVEHRLDSAKYLPSPNYDERPDSNDLSLIVIHCISLPPGEFGGDWIDRLFTNTLDPTAHPYFSGIHQLRVSAHLLIPRDGNLTQYVPFNLRAWHAGESSYQGRNRCNDFSIGIELEGSEYIPYTEQQYTKLSSVIYTLLDTYPSLSWERIVGHSDIAPTRKTDPGPSFDWNRL